MQFVTDISLHVMLGIIMKCVWALSGLSEMPKATMKQAIHMYIMYIHLHCNYFVAIYRCWTPRSAYTAQQAHVISFCRRLPYVQVIPCWLIVFPGQSGVMKHTTYGFIPPL